MSVSRNAGLGAGLMAFGQGLQQQMAETARQRREDSLLAIRRQFQLEDRESEREFTMEREAGNRQFQIDEANRRDALQFGRDQMQWDRGAEERERAAEMHDARIGLLEAQAEQGASSTDPSRWREMQLHRDQLIQQGMGPNEAYERAMQIVYPQRSDFEQQQAVRARMELIRSIQGQLANEFDREDLYAQAGIPPGTPPDQAMNILFETQWPAIERSLGFDRGRQEESQMSQEEILGYALEAIQQGASARDVAQEMGKMGIDRATIDAFMAENDPASGRALRTIQRRSQ